MSIPFAFTQQYAGVYSIAVTNGSGSSQSTALNCPIIVNPGTNGGVFFGPYAATNVVVNGNNLTFSVPGTPAQIEAGITSFNLTFAGSFSANDQVVSGTAISSSGSVAVSGAVLKVNPQATQFWKSVATNPTLLNQFVASVQQGTGSTGWNSSALNKFLQANEYQVAPADLVQAGIDTFNDLTDWAGTYRVVFASPSSVQMGTLLTIQNGIITIGSDNEVISNYTFTGGTLTWTTGSGSTSYPVGNLSFQYMPGSLSPSPGSFKIYGSFTGMITTSAAGSPQYMAMGLCTTVIPAEQQALNVINGDVATALHDFFQAAVGINIPASSIAIGLQVVEKVINDLYTAYTSIQTAYAVYQFVLALPDLATSALSSLVNAWNSNIQSAAQTVSKSVSNLSSEVTQIQEQYGSNSTSQEEGDGEGEEGGESGPDSGENPPGGEDAPEEGSSGSSQSGTSGEPAEPESPAAPTSSPPASSPSSAPAEESEPSEPESAPSSAGGGGGADDDDDDDDDGGLKAICCCCCC